MLDIFEMFYKDSPNKTSSLKNVKQINSFDASNYMEGISDEKHVVSFFSDIRLFQSFCQTRDRYKHILQTLPLWKSHLVDIDDS